MKWCNLLSAQPQFADKCTEYKGWENFHSGDWSNLLSSQLQFTEKAKEYLHGWVGLLSIKPELANECKCWKKLNYWHWCDLLKAQPQFVDKCTEYKGWGKFRSRDWSDLLKSQPQFWIYCPEESAHKIKEDPNKAKECKCLNKISHAEWCKILSIHPSLADKCKKWRWFYSSDWSYLLKSQPQFADKCPDKMYDEFSQEEWAELEAQHPNVFEEKHSLSTLRKLAK